MSKPVLAIDIDEVLFPFTPTFITFHNETYKTSLTLAHKQSDFLEQVTGDTEDMMLAKIDAYLKTPHYAMSEPVPGAAAVLRRLSKEWRLAIVTARTPNFRGSTEHFIEQHFPGIFSEIVYSCSPLDPKQCAPKKDLCVQINAVALVDDSLRNLQPLAGTGVAGILFGDYPWNRRTELPQHITRCANWRAIEAHLGSTHLRPTRTLAHTAQPQRD